MKTRMIAVMIAAIIMPTLSFAADKPADTKDVELKTDMDKVSYVIGTQIGSSFKQQEMDITLDALVKGISDAMKGKDLAMTPQEMQATMMAFQQMMIAKMQEKAQKAAKAGQEFLEKNKEKEGVVTLPSGLQYKVIKEGTGKRPAANDLVKVHYRGRLLDGTEFDSSYERGEPATFPVGQVIPGWTEALQLMKEGAKWELYIPSDLAYGQQGSGQQIGPNETLLFEVELLEVMGPAPQQDMPQMPNMR